jgi:putative integral membrane protein (TIGR02587 family)
MPIKTSRSIGQKITPDEFAGEANQRFGLGLVRAFGGAMLFALPMLMTMEMWWLGFYISPLRLALFTLFNIPLLIGLSYFAGFEDTSDVIDDVLDAFAAYAVGVVASTVVLLLFAVIGPGMSADEIIGKISVQAVPASIGALLVRSQFGERQRKEERKRRSSHYWGGLFIMAVGALYLSTSVASTEEMIMISYRMTEWHIIALTVFSLLVMHAFVHAATVKGKMAMLPDTTPIWIVFSRFTVVGYCIGLLISLYLLWIFGSIDGMSVGQAIQVTIVLGFPAALGAGAGRQIL